MYFETKTFLLKKGSFLFIILTVFYKGGNLSM